MSSNTFARIKVTCRKRRPTYLPSLKVHKMHTRHLMSGRRGYVCVSVSGQKITSCHESWQCIYDKETFKKTSNISTLRRLSNKCSLYIWKLVAEREKVFLWINDFDTEMFEDVSVKILRCCNPFWILSKCLFQYIAQYGCIRTCGLTFNQISWHNLSLLYLVRVDRTG